MLHALYAMLTELVGVTCGNKTQTAAAKLLRQPPARGNRKITGMPGNILRAVPKKGLMKHHAQLATALLQPLVQPGILIVLGLRIRTKQLCVQADDLPAGSVNEPVAGAKYGLESAKLREIQRCRAAIICHVTDVVIARKPMDRCRDV